MQELTDLFRQDSLDLPAIERLVVVTGGPDWMMWVRRAFRGDGCGVLVTVNENGWKQFGESCD